MYLNKLKLALFSLLFAQNIVFALSEGGNFLAIPAADVLGDKAFQVKGTIGYHQSAEQDRHPFITSARFGLFNSLELGVQFGSTISLDIKDQINQAFGFVPAIAIGARAFVESPEAYFYGISKDERREQTGEFYTVAQWGNNWWNILGGVSVFPGMTADEVAPFWGYEQKIGTQKLSTIYEGFFRRGILQHNIGLAFKPVKSLQISAGATNFYKYFFNEDGDFGFDIVRDGASSGYRAPGVYMSIAINGGFTPGIQNQKAQTDSLKRQVAIQSKDLNDLQLRIDDLEAAYTTGTGSVYTDIEKEYQEITKAYKDDNMNLDTLSLKEQLFIEKGMIAKRFIIRKAKDKNAEQESRIVAIRMMSHFPDNMFLEPLGSLVADNSNETIAREAAFALGTINTPEARKTLATVANQTTGIVRETIIEILGAL